jgi:hypothetical protein
MELCVPTNPTSSLPQAQAEPIAVGALGAVLQGQVIEGQAEGGDGAKIAHPHRGPSGRVCAAPIRVGGVDDIGKPDPNENALYVTRRFGKIQVKKGTPIEVSYASYSGLGNALPPEGGAAGAPAGAPQTDNDEEAAAAAAEAAGNEEEAKQDEFVYHRVTASDTLEGICVRYRVKPHQLRRWNAFPGNAFACLSELRVPRSVLPPGFVPQGAETIDEKVARLVRAAGGGGALGGTEARFYLEEAGADFDAALAAAKADLEWEESADATANGAAPPQAVMQKPSAPPAPAGSGGAPASGAVAQQGATAMPVAAFAPAAMAVTALGAAVGARVGLTAGTAIGARVGAAVSAAATQVAASE